MTYDWLIIQSAIVIDIPFIVVVVLSWVKAEPLYPHHNYILG